jgi:hypothetical protein
MFPVINFVVRKYCDTGIAVVIGEGSSKCCKYGYNFGHVPMPCACQTQPSVNFIVPKRCVPPPPPPPRKLKVIDNVQINNEKINTVDNV